MNKKHSIPESGQLMEYSMRMVVLQTGLTPDVIRVWEKRYNAVLPQRTATGRRFYSAQEVERLKLLRHLTSNGHSIGRIARLSLEQLREVAAQSVEVVSADPTPEISTSAVGSKAAFAPTSFFADAHLQQCLAAVQQFDAHSLENALGQTLIHLGPTGTIESVLEPLMDQINHLWESGSLRIAEEHVASNVLRMFLSSLMHHVVTPSEAPVIVVTTPSQQVHEIGALMAAATAAHQNWKVLYLGANLPASEIATSVQRSEARVLALSIVYPTDDARLPEELKELRRQLPETVILAGGRAAANYSDTLKQISARYLETLQCLRQELAVLRAPLSA